MDARSTDRCPIRLRAGAAAVLALLLPMVAAPAVEAGIAVSPLQQQVAVRPGGEAAFSLVVSNINRTGPPQPARVKVEIVDFTISPQGTVSFGENCSHSRSAAGWITLDAAELVLRPGESRKVKGELSAPYRADGDYWAAVLVTILRPKGDGSVNVILRTASAVFVRARRRNYAPRLGIGALSTSLPQLDSPGGAPAEPGDGAPPAAADGEPAFRVLSEITNEGRVSFVASGTAFVYRDGRRRVATIPLHAHRRRVLPGHTRRFVGVMPAPLPAGDYVLRCVFDTEEAHGRKTTSQAEFSVGADTALRWRERSAVEARSGLHVAPEALQRSLARGRFTTVTAVVSNQGAATMRIACRLQGDGLPAGWLRLSPAQFTLGPGARRSVLCRIQIPDAANSGDYTGALVLEAQCAGLTGQDKAERREIPIQISVER